MKKPHVTEYTENEKFVIDSNTGTAEDSLWNELLDGNISLHDAALQYVIEKDPKLSALFSSISKESAPV